MAAYLTEEPPFDATSIVAAANDEDTDAGKITITIATHGGTVTLMGVRVDVSGMDLGDPIIATVTSTGAADDFIEPGQSSDSIGVKVGTVMDGLTVTKVGRVTVLTCDGGTGEASITVEEGFNAAWETNGVGNTNTNIRVVVANVPAGVSFRWPGQGNFEEDGTMVLATDCRGLFRQSYGFARP